MGDPGNSATMFLSGRQACLFDPKTCKKPRKTERGMPVTPKSIWNLCVGERYVHAVSASSVKNIDSKKGLAAQVSAAKTSKIPSTHFHLDEFTISLPPLPLNRQKRTMTTYEIPIATEVPCHG
jgi:hypothetical protein